MASKYLQLFPTPQQLPHVVRDLTREILRYQPQDIIQFCALYFKAKQNKIEFAWTEAVPRAPRPSDYKKNQPLEVKQPEVIPAKNNLKHEEDNSKHSQATSHVTNNKNIERLEDKPGKALQNEGKVENRDKEKSGKSREAELGLNSEEVSGVSSLPENSDEAAKIYVSSMLEKVQKHIEAST